MLDQLREPPPPLRIRVCSRGRGGQVNKSETQLHHHVDELGPKHRPQARQVIAREEALHVSRRHALGSRLKAVRHSSQLALHTRRRRVGGKLIASRGRSACLLLGLALSVVIVACGPTGLV